MAEDYRMWSVAEKLEQLSYEPMPSAARSAYDHDTLARLPELVGFALPEDYVQFLREFPRTGMLNAYCAGLERAPWAPDALYPVDELYASSSRPLVDLLGRRQEQPSRGTPLYLLEIGGGLPRASICLDLRDGSFGNIYYWCRDVSVGKGLFLLARDFTAFIRHLIPCGEVEGAPADFAAPLR
jgi:hypothetical protein